MNFRDTLNWRERVESIYSYEYVMYETLQCVQIKTLVKIWKEVVDFMIIGAST